MSPAGSNAAAGFAGQPEYANSPEYWQEYDGDGAGVGRQGYAGDDSYGAGGQAGGREQQPFREYGAGGGYPGQGVPQGQPVSGEGEECFGGLEGLVAGGGWWWWW